MKGCGIFWPFFYLRGLRPLEVEEKMKRGMFALALGVVTVAGLGAGYSAPATVREAADPCHSSEGGGWLLVYKWEENIAPAGEDVKMIGFEGFDGQRFPSREDALCGAERVRRKGIRTISGNNRFETNIMPSTITPFPALLAEEQGIHPLPKGGE